LPQSSPLPEAGVVYDEEFPPLVERSAPPPPQGALSGEPRPAGGRRSARRSGAVRRSRKAGRRTALCNDRLAFLEEVLLANCHASGSHVDGGELPSRFLATAMRTARSRGVEEGLAWAKRESAKARSSWIERSGSNRAAQTSFVARALPVGTAETAAANMAAHREALTSEWKTSGDLLRRVRVWSSRWSRRFLGDPGRASSPGIPTLSSCAESTKRQGGLRGYVERLGVHEKAAALASTITDLPPQDAATLLQDASLLHHGFDLLEGDNVPPHRVIPVKERGLKVRVVTSPSAGYSLLGHVVRKRLLGGLRRDPAAQSTLIGIKDEDVFAYFSGASSDCVTSTDLKSATDLLPLDLVSALIDGLQDGGKFPPWEIEALRRLSGPQDLIYPGEDLPVRTRRGILMGLPTSWALLSLIHLFWWNEATVRAAAERRVKLRSAFAANRFVICGDDGLACTWRDVSSGYLSIVRACGGESSSGKHFTATGALRPRAVFLERLYEFATEDGRVAGGTRNGAIPLRGLVRPELPIELRGHGSDLFVPTAVMLLLSIDSTLANHPEGRGAVIRFLDHHSGLRRLGVSLGLVDGIPLRDGGTGLPLRGPLSVAAKRRRWITSKLRSEGRSVPSLIRGVIDPTWQLASELAVADLDSFVEGGTFVRQPGGAEPPTDSSQIRWCFGPPWHELVLLSTERLYNEYVLMLGMGPGKRPKLGERQLRRAIDRLYSGTFVPEGADLDLLPEADSVDVWIQRTRGPCGALLYPQWAGENLASEATRRGSLFSEIHGGLARFTRA
jgi:hypothetical protein